MHGLIFLTSYSILDGEILPGHGVLPYWLEPAICRTRHPAHNKELTRQAVWAKYQGQSRRAEF
jgi:hypothetical protein